MKRLDFFCVCEKNITNRMLLFIIKVYVALIVVKERVLLWEDENYHY